MSFFRQIAFAVLLGFLWGEALAAKPPELRVCFLEQNLPYSSSQGEPLGFDVETAREVAQVLGRRLLPVWVPQGSRILELEESNLPLRRLARGECDALFSVPGPLALKGFSQLALGAPYYGAAFELVGHRDETLPGDLASLDEVFVGVQAHTVAQFVLDYEGLKGKLFFSPEAALEALASGKIRAALLWGPAAGWYLRNHPEGGLAFVEGYQPKPVVCWNEHVATRKKDVSLRREIDRALSQLAAQGILEKLLARYGLPPHPPFSQVYSVEEVLRLQRKGEGL